MHRTHPQRFNRYGLRLLSFQREHGISDNRVDASSTTTPMRYATLRVVPSPEGPPQTRLALRLIACLVLALLASATFEFLVLAPMVSAMLQAQR